MSYEAFQKNYETLTPEQQLIVYNLVISLGKLNAEHNEKPDSAQKESLSQTQKSKAKDTLHQIQASFADNKGWTSEEEMLSDMADFRRKRLAKCEY